MRIVILTGAGISAESGLATFRQAGGTWARIDPAEVATPEAFARDPARVHAFYNARRGAAARASPNAAHAALARLQEAPGIGLTLVTQNVDSLHERAGMRDVIHMHGTLAGARCAACGHRWPAPAQMQPDDPCPACARPATRPDVVWFNEEPLFLPRIDRALARADLFAAIGTSGQVWPAAGFAEAAGRAGAHCVELNLEPTGNPAFDEIRQGHAARIVPEWVHDLIAGAR